MVTRVAQYVTAACLTLLLIVDFGFTAGRDPEPKRENGSQLPVNIAAVEVIQDWPEVSREVATEMMQKYGEPEGVAEDHIYWSDKENFHEISVHKDAVEHNFPYRHMDVVKHTVYMRVPTDKLDELSEFNGSLSVNRTRGTVSAFCDSEQHNVLALNLAADIINNQKTTQEARQTFASLTAESGELTTGDADREYIEALRFDIVNPNTVRDPGESFTGTIGRGTGTTGGTTGIGGTTGGTTGTTGRIGTGTTGRGTGADTIGLGADTTLGRQRDTLRFDTLGVDTLSRDTLNLDTTIRRDRGTGTGGTGTGGTGTGTGGGTERR